MKNYLRIIYAEILSETTIIVALSLWYIIWAIVLNFGFANSSHFGNFPFIVLFLYAQTTRMELDSLIKLPIKRTFVCFIKPIKLVLQFLILYSVKIISLFFICHARFDELIPGSAMLLSGFTILGVYLFLAKEIGARLRIKNEYLHNWTMSLIAGVPIIATMLLLISGSIKLAVLLENIKYLGYLYLIIGVPSIFIMFRNRKEFMYFTGSPEVAKMFPLFNKKSSSL